VAVPSNVVEIDPSVWAKGLEKLDQVAVPIVH
jgi:hypothetical protein